MVDCVFCRIIAKEEKAHIIWEDDQHLAFLSIYPNIEGFTVLVTKEHLESYCFNLTESRLTALIMAAKRVAKLLDTKLPDVGRTGLIMEGFGVDHAHVKLFPMKGTKPVKGWKPIHSTERKYFLKYEGYISSHDSQRANEDDLTDLSEKIRNF